VKRKRVIRTTEVIVETKEQVVIRARTGTPNTTPSTGPHDAEASAADAPDERRNREIEGSGE
jgi:hypothetical protein